MQKVQTQSWSSALLPLGSKISQAIMNLEKSCMQIVLVVSEGNKLEGTLTDGDIRRALLKGFNLESDVNDIISREPLVVPPESGLALPHWPTAVSGVAAYFAATVALIIAPTTKQTAAK